MNPITDYINAHPENTVWSPEKGWHDMPVQPQVTFNMDLANGRTSLRFCYEAADVLAADGHVYSAAKDELDTVDDDNEFISEIVDDWTSRLESNGYAVYWNAGDVVVYDLRPLSDDDREAFYSEMENY